MDYGKLTKNELILLCEERKISYTSSWTKERLEEELIKQANAEKETPKKTKATKTEQGVGPNSVGKAGVIINIIGTSVLLVLVGWLFVYLAVVSFMTIFYAALFSIIMLVISIGYLTGMILNIIFSVGHLKGKTSKLKAGIMGIFFGGLLGGILILCGEDDQEVK